jgi:5-methylcytosine-specific restriction endonuclease McrA
MTPLGTTTYKRAIRLIVTGKAEAIANSEIKIHPTINVPLVIRLVKAIRNLWRTKVPWNKSNVHVRDDYTCQYCSLKLQSNQATVDHVIPKDQGGKNDWENTVCSCFACNNTKGNKTPNQARMTLKRKPYTPTIMEFMMMKIQSDGLYELLKDLGIY